MHYSGSEQGVDWTSDENEAGVFTMRASFGGKTVTAEYRCFYPTMFGIDVSDMADMDVAMTALIKRARSAAEDVAEDTIKDTAEEAVVGPLKPI